MKKTLNRYGFTLIELLVVISIIAILASLAVPAVMNAMTKGQMMQTLNNARQLHISTQQMALDAMTTGDSELGWPGDTGGTWSGWAENIVPGYMSANDFLKMISAPGVAVPVTDQPTAPSKSAIKVYQVKENNPGNTIFLTTANYTYNTELDAGDAPYGDKGFVVIRKAGDGVILQQRQATFEDEDRLESIVGIEPEDGEVQGQPSSE